METIIEIQEQSPLKEFTLPDPIITIEEVRFSKTDIQQITVYSWDCSECGRKMGKSSALRSKEVHNEIICGRCAQKKDPRYQEWLRDQVLMKELMWR